MREKLFVKIANRIRNTIYSEEYMKNSKRSEKDFSRNRKMNFADYIIFILRCGKRGLQAGLNEFFREKKSNEMLYSKQAFSKGRERILPEAIKMLFNETVEDFYAERNTKRHKGYRILAIDGTDYNLPCTDELLEEFGSEKYAGNIIRVQAMGSCLYDVMNDFIVDASIGRYNENERVHAIAHLERLLEIRTGKELVLFDRGYPSKELMFFLETHNIKYLMRCTKDNFLKEIRDFKGSDAWLTHTSKELKLRFRVVNFNKKYTFLTNLSDNEFSAKEIYDLYHKRWVIETQYNRIKNKMVIENFSGTSKVAIYQDFWATMTLSNIMSAAEFDAMMELENCETDDHNTKTLEKKINRATLINSLKDQFIGMFLQTSKRKRLKIFSRIVDEISHSVVSVVPDRSFPRLLSSRAKIFHKNQKSLS